MPDYLPDKYESGTMNLPGIIGLHAALTYLEEAGIPAIHQKKMKLTGYFLKRIQEIPQAHVAGKQTIQDRLAVVSLDFPEYDNAAIALRNHDKGRSPLCSDGASDLTYHAAGNDPFRLQPLQYHGRNRPVH